MGQTASQTQTVTRSALLDSRRVAEEAEAVILALPMPREEGFESLYSYLTVDDPAYHLLPLHFLPLGEQESVDTASLHELGVAAKLEYARNRWLDELVDAADASSLPLSFHQLNDALVEIIIARYAGVLDGPNAGSFFSTLVGLHARHGLSAILDVRRRKGCEPSMNLEEYIEHAEARHGPMRAALDAVLLLAGANENELQGARSSWHNWMLGVQFYDDALDIEEDLRDGNLSWASSRTLVRFCERYGREPVEGAIDADLLYETALTEGVVCEGLVHAAAFFAASARLAESAYPTWATLQRECLNRTVSVREDFEKLIAQYREL